MIQFISNSVRQKVPTIIFKLPNNNNKKYIFNLAQPFQKYASQHLIKSNNQFIFFTRIQTDSISGLIGYLLSNCNKSNAKIYTYQGLIKFFQNIESTLGRNIFPYSFYDMQTQQCLIGLKMEKIDKDITTRKEIMQILNTYKENDLNNAKLFFKNGIFQDQQLSITPIFIQCKQRQNKICQYIIEIKKKQNIDIKKVEKIGFPKKLIKELIKNRFIQYQNKTIYIKDILVDNETKNQIILILDIPQKIYLDKVINNKQIKKYFKSNINKQYQVNSILHIQSQDIINNKVYIQFLKQFDNPFIIVCKQYLIQQYRNEFLDKKILKIKNKEFSKIFPYHYNKNKLKQQQYFLQNIQNAKFFCNYSILNNSIQKLQKVQKLFQINNNIIQIIHQYIDKNYKQNNKSKFKEFDPQICILGTVAKVPNRLRNVSSILINFSQNFCILLDAGQGTYYQLQSIYGDKVEEKLINIKIIFISHIHSDHNLGIFTLLNKRSKLLRQQQLNDIYLIIPFNMVQFVFEYFQNIQKLNCKIIPIQFITQQKIKFNIETMSKQENQHLDYQNQFNFKLKQLYIRYNEQFNKNLKQLYQILKLNHIIQFNPIEVIHCKQSYGLIIKHQSQIKISFSGDTSFCHQFIKAAHNSTIMIHQSTYDDTLQELANERYHSVFKNAITSAMQSNCWRLILYHFSGRYVPYEQILKPQLYKDQMYVYALNNTIVGSDYMRMKISDCNYMPFVSQNIHKLIDFLKIQQNIY